MLISATLLGCGGGTLESNPVVEESPPPSAVFEFRLHGRNASESFRVETASPEVIEQMKAQLMLPQAERNLFAIGGIMAGDGGVNAPWGWHFSNARLAEMSIELCDGIPSMVQDDLQYWLNTVKSFCPWTSYVHAQLR